MKKKRMPPVSKFIKHLARNVIFGVLFIAFAEFMGMLGYHYLEDMTWVDSFANAAMILSGMGPLTPLTTVTGKLFAGFYALFSGLVFIGVIVLIFSPVLHRVFHKVHLDTQDND
jgi:hypothetical protein